MLFPRNFATAPLVNNLDIVPTSLELKCSTKKSPLFFKEDLLIVIISQETISHSLRDSYPKRHIWELKKINFWEDQKGITD